MADTNSSQTNPLLSSIPKNQSDDFMGQRNRRIQKVQTLRDLGIDPYPARSNKQYANKYVLDNFKTLENQEVTLTGRLMTWRDHGKIMFADLQDQTGKIQLFLKKDELEGNLTEGHLEWTHRNLIDAGDFVEAHGTLMITATGQESLLVKSIRILSKTIRPLPNTFDDKEQQFRRRYLDLTINADKKARFERKATFWKVSREYMHQNGFMEVEVPVLEHVTGGADARPFTTHHNDLNEDFYLRISTELYQKRLIGAGFEKIYTLAPNFRNEGLSDEHLQEYSQLEWYWAYADYRDNMEYVKNMIRHVAQEVYGTTKFSTRGHEFDLADEWKEIDYASVIQETHGIDIFSDTDDVMAVKLRELGVDLPGVVNRNRLIDNLWKVIRKTLSGPAFLVNEPKFMSPLAKSRPDNPALTERFHIILGGSELGNGYTEINDPQDQLERFLDQQRMRDTGDDEAQMLDIDFVEMLEYGMPPTSGYAHSERLFWFLENVTAREGTLFPQLKFEVEEMTRKVYEKMLQPLNITLDKAVPTKQPQKPAQKKSFAPLPGLSREEALKLVNDHIVNKNLVKHCIAVEGAMRALAIHFGENPEEWGMAGLLHDADWEATGTADMNAHTLKTIEWIEAAGDTTPEVKRAILSHNFAINQEPIPQSPMEWALCCCDELTGLITAATLVTPEKKLSLVEVPSIMKKFKSKNFAAAVNRDDITRCEAKLKIPLEQFVQIVLDGMRAQSDELGL